MAALFCSPSCLPLHVGLMRGAAAWARQAVPHSLIEAARARLDAAGDHTYQDESLETSSEFCDLVSQYCKARRQRQRRSADLCWCLVPSLYPVTLLAYPSGWLVSRGEG